MHKKCTTLGEGTYTHHYTWGTTFTPIGYGEVETRTLVFQGTHLFILSDISIYCVKILHKAWGGR